jgi:hypothetical protein
MGCMGKQKAMHPPLDPLRLQTCVMWIKSHVKNDTGQGMVAPYLKSSFEFDLLPFLQTTKRGNASHHIWKITQMCLKIE